MATMKETGQQAAAGFARSNAPIPQSNPIPGGMGQIPTVDTAKIAPTSGPAGDGQPLPPVDPDKLHREDHGLFY
ncbi:MAG: hypothetical protein ACLP07_16615 [Terracidiphilus sp.]